MDIKLILENQLVMMQMLASIYNGSDRDAYAVLMKQITKTDERIILWNRS